LYWKVATPLTNNYTTFNKTLLNVIFRAWKTLWWIIVVKAL